MGQSVGFPQRVRQRGWRDFFAGESGSREHRTSSACGGVVGHDALYERLQSQFGARDRHLINEQIGIGAIFDDVERTKLGLISQKGKLADAIRYALSRWEGLTRFLDDGRIELDSSPSNAPSVRSSSTGKMRSSQAPMAAPSTASSSLR
jgi:hypothetical protein